MINLDNDGIKQKVSLIDTPGFGISKNDELLQESIVDYIKEQFDLYIQEESKVRRNPKYEDSRIHCLLYFIPSSASGLKQRDIAFLQKINGLVNIIPIISKADGLSIEEYTGMKENIKDQLKFYEIQTFDFEQEDFPSSLKSKEFNKRLPLASICSNDAEVSVRLHPAGEIDLFNPGNCDLTLIREIFLNMYLDLFIETTSNELYEKYRADFLESALHE